MKKQLTLSLLFCTLFGLSASTILINILIVQTQHSRPSGADHDLSGMMYGVAWFTIIAMAICSTPVYLNVIRRVRKQIILSALSFFFLPVLMALSIVLFIRDFELTWRIHVLGMSPYILAMAISFYLFRKKYSNELDNNMNVLQEVNRIN